MGEVWKARDPRVGRDVALKVSKEQFSKRFEYEARAIGALNHPNICTLYDVGPDYLVMEYVEGAPLQGLLPLDQALQYAGQICDALIAAHKKGITHRDLKPANILVTKSGVKLLDFGLAKFTQAAPGPNDATLTMTLTGKNEIVGTLYYMSPEQARGEAVDGRSDLWSLGVVIYEMVTGQRPFRGDGGAATVHALLHAEPAPLTALRTGVPLELDRVVGKCLAKDAADRYQHADDLAVDLRRLKRDTDSGRTASPGKTRRLAPALAVMTVIIAAAALGVHLLSRRTGESSPRNATFTQLTDQAGPELYPSLSPDGKSFVYQSRASGNWDIYFQRVGGKNPVNLTKDSSLDDIHPAFSPDGERIVFRSQRDGGGIFVMGATGESAKRITDFGFHPSWSPDGTEIVCATMNFTGPDSRGPSSRLFRVKLATGEKLAVTPENEDAVQPQWSPDGRRIAFWSVRSGQRDIFTVAASGGPAVAVTSDAALDWSPAWSPDGRYLYFASDRGGTMNLWRVRMEEASGKALGPPEPLTTPSPYSGQITLARGSPQLAFMHRSLAANLYKVAIDPLRGVVTGQPEPVIRGSRLAVWPKLSPDGQWLTFFLSGRQEDIAVVRTDGSGLRNLTDDLHRDRGPIWSPDGKQILFYSNRSGKFELWTIQPDGSGLRQLTFESRWNLGSSLWSPDGARLAYVILGHGTYVMDAAKPWRDQTPEELPSLAESGKVFVPKSWSADGVRLAGHRVGTDVGCCGISVFSFLSRRFQRLTEFGANPVWLHDQRRLLFQSEGKIYLLDSSTGTTREFLSIPPNEVGDGFDISRDNQTLYFVLRANEADVWLMSLP